MCAIRKIVQRVEIRAKYENIEQNDHDGAHHSRDYFTDQPKDLGTSDSSKSPHPAALQSRGVSTGQSPSPALVTVEVPMANDDATQLQRTGTNQRAFNLFNPWRVTAIQTPSNFLASTSNYQSHQQLSELPARYRPLQFLPFFLNLFHLVLKVNAKTSHLDDDPLPRLAINGIQSIGQDTSVVSKWLAGQSILCGDKGFNLVKDNNKCPAFCTVCQTTLKQTAAQQLESHSDEDDPVFGFSTPSESMSPIIATTSQGSLSTGDSRCKFHQSTGHNSLSKVSDIPTVATTNQQSFTADIETIIQAPSSKTLATTILDAEYEECRTSLNFGKHSVLLINGWKNEAANTKNIAATIHNAADDTGFLDA
ncbi:hypothetical protein PR048_001422 [Dryococelus australis]|uniref:Uncharacterized protein n=1 Tax=Dryococelus australis TaxID=614101 RepID=A0ABQ9IIS9_9NEOP|nr:hypothetical protein PR048_001422 [Dryococelus australis]